MIFICTDVLVEIFKYLNGKEVLKALTLNKDIRKHLIKGFRGYFSHIIFIHDIDQTGRFKYFKKALVLLNFKRLRIKAKQRWLHKDIIFEYLSGIEYLYVSQLGNRRQMRRMINLKEIYHEGKYLFEDFGCLWDFRHRDLTIYYRGMCNGHPRERVDTYFPKLKLIRIESDSSDTESEEEYTSSNLGYRVFFW